MGHFPCPNIVSEFYSSNVSSAELGRYYGIVFSSLVGNVAAVNLILMSIPVAFLSLHIDGTRTVSPSTPRWLSR